MTTHAIVLRTAGTNCEHETKLALERGGASAELLHLHRLVAEPARLDSAAILVLPGGFSYGDDIAAGRVLGHELRTFLGAQLTRFVSRGCRRPPHGRREALDRALRQRVGTLRVPLGHAAQ
jgi:phosphoribosylformylglycinamidine synthase